MKLATRIFRRDDYYITSPFGWRKDPKTGEKKFHAGCDYGTYGQKWPQYALEEGTVETVYTDNYGAKIVRIRYDRLGYRCTHCHLDSIVVHTGQVVDENTLLGYTGMTGYATGVHLDLRVQYNGSSTYVDPESFDYEPAPGPTPPGPTPPPTPPEPTPVDPWKGVVKKGSALYDVNGNPYSNPASADRIVTVTGELGNRWQVWGSTFTPHTVYVDKSNVTQYSPYPYNAVVKKGSPLYNIYGKKYPNSASADRPVQVRGFINGRYQVYGQTFNPHIVYVDKSSLK
jgi:murein DD-endopeptidase MepM/ murein hydrolase activator NlpD